MSGSLRRKRMRRSKRRTKGNRVKERQIVNNEQKLIKDYFI